MVNHKEKHTTNLLVLEFQTKIKPFILVVFIIGYIFFFINWKLHVNKPIVLFNELTYCKLIFDVEVTTILKLENRFL